MASGDIHCNDRRVVFLTWATVAHLDGIESSDQPVCISERDWLSASVPATLAGASQPRPKGDAQPLRIQKIPLAAGDPAQR